MEKATYPSAEAVREGMTRPALASAAAVLIALVACGGGTGPGGTVGGTPDAGTGTITGDGTKGTGTGGSGVPQPNTDAAAWFITAAGTTSAGQAIDFDAFQGAVQGGIPVGSSRSAGVLVYNVSRKTDLTITAASVAGANASDFALDAANVANALATTIPPNKTAFVRFGVTFTPQAAGLRQGTLELASNAGSASVPLSGTGLPLKPVLQTVSGPLNFVPASAPTTVRVTNAGGVALRLQNPVISGTGASAFQFFVINPALSRCNANTLLGPLESCSFEIGPAAGQVAPKNAQVDLSSDDPVHPTVSIGLVLGQ